MRKSLIIVFSILICFALGSVLLLLVLNPAALVVMMINSQRDTDVTTSPEYNFSSFSGSVWKTKVKIALADLKEYKGEHDLNLLPPKYFEKTRPDYTTVHDMQLITVLPVGTCLRIGQLMQDNGQWGGVRVTATLESGSYTQKTVYVDTDLLGKNEFIWPGSSSSTNWGVNPDMLEKP